MAMKMRVAQDNCDSCLQSCEGDNARRSRLSAQFRTASLMVPSLDEGGAVGAATELGCVDIMIARASPAGPERVYPMYIPLPTPGTMVYTCIRSSMYTVPGNYL